MILIRDGHSFIRGRGEHLFAQLYTWAMCREACTKLGINWEERILRLHWMVHVVVHIQQFINKRNVKYKPWSMGSNSWTVHAKANYPFPAAHPRCAGSVPFGSARIGTLFQSS